VGEDRYAGAWIDRSSQPPVLGMALVAPEAGQVTSIQDEARRADWSLTIDVVKYSRAQLGRLRRTLGVECLRWPGGDAPGHGSIGQRLCDRSARGGRIRVRLLPSVSRREFPSSRRITLAVPTGLVTRGRAVRTCGQRAVPVRGGGNRVRDRALGYRSSASMDTSRLGRRRCGLDAHMDRCPNDPGGVRSESGWVLGGARQHGYGDHRHCGRLGQCEGGRPRADYGGYLDGGRGHSHARTASTSTTRNGVLTGTTPCTF
jgi:hypothetical protein